MKVVIQRVKKANVSVDKKLINEIEKGFCIFVGFTDTDTIEDIKYITRKIVNLRVFDDENGIMNRSILDIKGEILSISQFTLYANTKKGNRPSYIKALNGSAAIKLYDEFNHLLNETIPTKTGVFGANMQIELINDGPITITIDSKEK